MKLNDKQDNSKLHAKACGQHIKYARNAAKLKPPQLAKKSNLSVETVWACEGGKRPLSIDTLTKFCNVLKVTPEYLLSSELDVDFINAYNEMPELFEDIFNLTLSEKKRIEDIVLIMLNQDKKAK